MASNWNYEEATPTSMTEIGVSPIFVCNTQSVSPCLVKPGATVSDFQKLSTAGCGVPEALRLMATKASKLGVEFRSRSSATGESSRKSRCGAAP